MHLSHIFEDLKAWYGTSFKIRAGSSSTPSTKVPHGTLTIPEGPTQVEALAQVQADLAQHGYVGHSSSMQPASRLHERVVDNYGIVWPPGRPSPSGRTSTPSTTRSPSARIPMSTRWDDARRRGPLPLLHADQQPVPPGPQRHGRAVRQQRRPRDQRGARAVQQRAQGHPPPELPGAPRGRTGRSPWPNSWTSSRGPRASV